MLPVQTTETLENTKKQEVVLSLVLKRKSREQQLEKMHKEYGELSSMTAPARSGIEAVHEKYAELLKTKNIAAVTAETPQPYHPTMTPATVDQETASINRGLGESIARRAADLASTVANIPSEDPSISAAFAPIIESAEKHAIGKVDNAADKRKLWIWGAAVVGIAAGAVLVLGRRPKEERKN